MVDETFSPCSFIPSYILGYNYIYKIAYYDIKGNFSPLFFLNGIITKTLLTIIRPIC